MTENCKVSREKSRNSIEVDNYHITFEKEAFGEETVAKVVETLKTAVEKGQLDLSNKNSRIRYNVFVPLLSTTKDRLVFMALLSLLTTEDGEKLFVFGKDSATFLVSNGITELENLKFSGVKENVEPEPKTSKEVVANRVVEDEPVVEEVTDPVVEDEPAPVVEEVKPEEEVKADVKPNAGKTGKK